MSIPDMKKTNKIPQTKSERSSHDELFLACLSADLVSLLVTTRTSSWNEGSSILTIPRMSNPSPTTKLHDPMMYDVSITTFSENNP